MISTVTPAATVRVLPWITGPSPDVTPDLERRMLGLPSADEQGREIPRGPAAAMFAADQASRGLGMELLHVGRGTAVVQMRVALQMLNGHSIGHGGYVFMLADTAFACACNSDGPATVAAGADISFIAPVREGDILTATAIERARYGRNGIYVVSVRRGDDVVAEFRGRSHTLG
jgi:acyl-CoA thioesterase